MQTHAQTQQNIEVVFAAGRHAPAGSSRQGSGLEAWQGQGLDEVLRPVQPSRSVQPSERLAGLGSTTSLCLP